MEQEQTMFDDLRRGFAEDSQGLTEFEKIAQEKHQNLINFAFFAFFTSKMTSKLKLELIRPT